MNAHDPLEPLPADTLESDSGLRIALLSNGRVKRIDAAGVMVNLFVASEADPGLGGLWLRQRAMPGAPIAHVPLLGPCSPLRRADAPAQGASDGAHRRWAGHWLGLDIELQLRLAQARAAWFWHLLLHRDADTPCDVDLIAMQDIGLSDYAALRLNEHYVSHYIDLQPLEHARHGWLVAARQNLPQRGQHPSCLMGGTRRAAAFATDARQWLGLDVRAGLPPQGLRLGLPAERLQREHASIGLQTCWHTLQPGQHIVEGVFGAVRAHHPAASGRADLGDVEQILQLPEALPLSGEARAAPAASPAIPTAFSRAPWLASRDLEPDELQRLFPGQRRHEELEGGSLMSFFIDDHTHVVLRAKELLVERPHGHILRTGRHAVPDETALTSTVWMGGVFHSMVTQGHVSINRCLSTVHGWLGEYRSHGQRVFVRAEGQPWQQLGLPSAFAMHSEGCRWIYAHAGGLLELCSQAEHAPHALTLSLRVLQGPPLCWRITHHVALGGDDGTPAARLELQRAPDGVRVGIPAGSELAARFPGGELQIGFLCGGGTPSVHDDAVLYDDGLSRREPYVVIDSPPATVVRLRLEPRLVDGVSPPAAELQPPRLAIADSAQPAARAIGELNEILPWYLHNAGVHYLSPRGLEQYSGGGWGTRDVCQGPLEALLALDRPDAVRDLLCRVFRAQDPSGDWPQWFMFFERDRHIRAGDSHGDIVFWPLLGLARYLISTGDAGLLDEAVPYHADKGQEAETGSIWEHVQRARQVIAGRRIAGTRLAAYGHGDWNDSLQPADPRLREHLCSSWTVTLHHQMASTLAKALRACHRDAAARALEDEARGVREDFRRWLMPGGTVCGYALFEPAEPAPRVLLHPDDRTTGVQYSLLPMMHAVLEDLLDPNEARRQHDLIEQHLTGPDGARLFDRPLAYAGGPQRLFQRAESSAFFGREIGVMYMHAHLRYAEMLAHLGEGGRLLAALQRAHPVGLRQVVPETSRRQANCYGSSSDAAFADRYQAQAEYGRVGRGEITLEVGWRVYSSGPGIALGLVVGSLLGLRRQGEQLCIDPVVAPGGGTLTARCRVAGREIALEVIPGPRGCGPVDLQVSGRTLAFDRQANPHRLGAARIPLSALGPADSAGPAVTVRVSTA